MCPIEPLIDNQVWNLPLKNWLYDNGCTKSMGSKLFMSSLQLRVGEGMAGHNDSSASEKKSSEATNDLPTFNTENVQSNMKIIYYRFVLKPL